MQNRYVVTLSGEYKMSESKVITTRLPNDLLDNIDELVKDKFDNRSEAMRSLLELGIDRNCVLERIERVEQKLERLLVVAEAQYQHSYISTIFLLESGNDALKEKMMNSLPDIKSTANRMLAKILVERFGE
ncbi:hypothetical protein H8K32_19655 [Undibacterium jejuense]|uniref:Uncharacterized protein n=1 Tax=Undibacterium jejuense TaxID=1344949 RepID=A0A923HRD3_9BURK|nr:hypothetical protein [Undibacterium jejuense]MBC3864321.1 hypothetical protein [Undibacterium jejuense]